MNDTIQIPVEIGYSVAGSGGGGVEMIHLLIFAVVAALAVLFFMVMQSNNRAEKQDILRTVDQRETERERRERDTERWQDVMRKVESEALKRRGAEDKADFTRNKVGA